MCSADVFAWGMVGLLFGPPMAIWPYKLARWEEILDSIGRKPSGRVKPAGWKVGLTKVVGLGLSLFGGGFLLFCVLL